MKAKLKSVLIAIFITAQIEPAHSQVIVWGNNNFGLKDVPADATNIIALAAGDTHCLALRSNGTVVAWGASSSGAKDVPADLTNAVAVAAGSTHSLALRSDGTIAMWGRFFASGVNTVPVSATNVVALALGPGAQHALALRADGTVVDWGNSSYGLTNIPGTARGIVSVAAGAFHGLALRSDGKVVAWGDNSRGQTNVPASATNIVAVATGWYGNAALRADGTMLVWGTASTPSAAYGFTNLVEVACPFNDIFNPNATLALRRNGTLTQWQGTTLPVYSTNNIAAIGAGSYNGFAVVGSGAPVFPGLPVNRTVASGARAYFRMNAVGALPLFYQWSCNGTNLPGVTNTVLTLTNVQPELAGTYYTVTASNAFGLATSGPMFLNAVPAEVVLKATNSAAVIGATLAFTSSVIGQGPFSYQWQFNGTNLMAATNSLLTLTDVQLAAAGNYSLIVSNFYGYVTNSVVLTVAPTITTQSPQNQWSFPGGTAAFNLGLQAIIPVSYQWQFNGTNLPGATSTTLTLTNLHWDAAGVYSVVVSNAFEIVTHSATLVVSPVAGWGWNSSGQLNIPVGLTNVIAVAAGISHSVALHSNGTVMVWGGDSVRRAVPADLTNAIAISAGNWGSLALRTDGSVASWGHSIGGYTNAPPEATNVVAISAGEFHNLVLRSDGTMVGWGQNVSGESTVPTELTNAVAVAAGSQFSLALKADGQVVAWGYNGNGQTNVPAALSNVVAISAGNIHAMALKDDGTVAVWGSTSYGLPNIPPTATNVVAIAAGFGHCLALRADGMVVAWGYHYNGETNTPAGLANVMTIAAGNSHNLALVKAGPPAPQVSLRGPIWNANGLNFSLPTQSDRVYRLEYKHSLNDLEWTPMPLVAGNGGWLTLTDPAPNSSQRFYRVRQW
jgi:alpha-tubulin suppressor-like RCC1 family protein